MLALRSAAVLLASLAVAACGGGSGGDSDTIPPPVPQPTTVLGLTIVSDAEWDSTAVRQVLNTFAYGGYASDAQIETWANMPPLDAIREMLTFDEHNLKLAPPASADTDALASRSGRLTDLSRFWASNDPSNPVLDSLRPYHEFPSIVWMRAALSRGLNPFRQRVGLWETNFHMAVNQRVGVTSAQVFRYYDGIVDALGEGRPYQDVLANAATSAAIARQYGHFENRWLSGVCYCNEDFAREYHQLFFGILGAYDPARHETITIKNTAAALTDMRLAFDTAQMDFVDFLTYGSQFHTPGPLEILRTTNTGANALERIDALSDVAIREQESLDALPLMIIRGLADDDLDAREVDALRRAWRSMATKSLLEFLRAYAVSDLFHSPTRSRLRTSVDRLFVLTTRATLANRDNYLEIYTPYDLATEDTQPFAPRHNVFGDATGAEAADSSAVFRNNYNRVTRDDWRYRLPVYSVNGISWEKDWGSVIPRNAAGNYGVKEVAEWLWQRYVADGLENFGALERANVYAFLAYDADLIYLVNYDELNRAGRDVNDLALYDFSRVVTAADLTTSASLQALLSTLADQTLPLSTNDAGVRQAANARVGSAINFIAATPFVFAEQGH
jgi:hypothetical protein